MTEAMTDIVEMLDSHSYPRLDPNNTDYLSNTNTMHVDLPPRPSPPCSIPVIDLTSEDDENAMDLTLGV